MSTELLVRLAVRYFYGYAVVISKDDPTILDRRAVVSQVDLYRRYYGMTVHEFNRFLGFVVNVADLDYAFRRIG